MYSRSQNIACASERGEIGADGGNPEELHLWHQQMSVAPLLHTVGDGETKPEVSNVRRPSALVTENAVGTINCNEAVEGRDLYIICMIQKLRGNSLTIYVVE